MSKVVKVAFFKAMYGSVLSKTISVVTSSIYSHTELIIGNYWIGSNIDLAGTSGITKLKKPKMDPDEWDIVSIKVTNKQYKSIKKDAMRYVGSGYSFSNALKSQFSMFNVETKDEFFCSEFVAFLLTKHKILNMKTSSSRYDPGGLFIELNNKIKYTKKNISKIDFSKLTSINYSKEELYFKW